jgi:hypothetical protein
MRRDGLAIDRWLRMLDSDRWTRPVSLERWMTMLSSQFEIAFMRLMRSVREQP